MSNLDDLANFFLDGDLDDDPFAPPKDSNKRKSPGDVNVDEEVKVAKKANVPRIKLDQERYARSSFIVPVHLLHLLTLAQTAFTKGHTRAPETSKGLEAEGKRSRGISLPSYLHAKSKSAHKSQWGDATRLLSFYQDWLDDLFPKGKFLDALAMVEKAGHNQNLQRHRVDWINEGRPKTSVVDEGADADDNAQPTTSGDAAPTRIAPIFDKPASGRPKTPDFDDLFGDEDDIYNATPVAARKTVPAAATGDEPDEDELDALMTMDAESGPSTSATTKKTSASAGAVHSLFGDGKPKPAAPPRAEEPDDFDDWDAFMAEAEAEPPLRQKATPAAAVSAVTTTVQQTAKSGEDDVDEDDDLDALMAEAEAQSEPAKPLKVAAASVAKTDAPVFDEDEEAMAEMDGLW